MDKENSIAPVARKFKLGEEPDDVEYWMSRPETERISAVEELRQAYYGADYETRMPMQKVYRIVKRRVF